MTRALRTFRVHPSLPEPLLPLAELAGNLRWSWDPEARELFRWADAEAWEAVDGNPSALLGALSDARMAELAGDARFVGRLEEVHGALQTELTRPAWVQRQRPDNPRVAYFSPEFGITTVMPTYSGGLGVLAGDHLKAASDLGLDMVGVGLLYRHGYFRQHLDADGWQQERYPDLNPLELPLRRLEHASEPVLVEVPMGPVTALAQVWIAQVGRVPLLLLDTEVPGNAQPERAITDRLYGGDTEHRLRQELVLGIGGVRALRAAVEAGELDGAPEVFHSNEGHAGFLGLERVRERVAEGLSFAEAVEAARSTTLFTTHTPVAAGIDKFPRELIERYFGDLADGYGTDVDGLMELGRLGDEHGIFNMAAMGMRLSAHANGVSELHGTVAREMFQGLWPDLPADEVPVDAVTNGVHAATWIGPEQRELYSRYLAPNWPRTASAWEGADQLPDEVLWRTRGRARERLVAEVRDRVREQVVRRGGAGGSLNWVDELLDPEALTIGFARRFATYKRGALLLRQPERLKALLTDTERPVQLVFAGKSHPRDDQGKGIIRELVHLAGSDPLLQRRMVFVEDYDMDLAATLYAGCDVWLNTPRRPFEACGTSGEKALLNGSLHCSVLDGWWDELYDPAAGFAIGGRGQVTDPEQQDAADAEALFELLERTIVPRFYDRTESPLPTRWLQMIRRSLVDIGPKVLATKMVRRYAEEHYEPLAARSRELLASGAKPARELAAWKQRVQAAWDGVRVAEVEVDDAVAAKGEERHVAVVVELGDLRTDEVVVEALHGPVSADGHLEERHVLTLAHAGAGKRGTQRYTGQVRCAQAGEYGVTARVRPTHERLRDPAEVGLAAWPHADDQPAP